MSGGSREEKVLSLPHACLNQKYNIFFIAVSQSFTQIINGYIRSEENTESNGKSIVNHRLVSTHTKK